MSETFGDALSGVREESGFSSSRSFFNKNGGAGFFDCTYRHYLNIEGGRALPNVALTRRIAAALGLISDRARAKRFVKGYLQSLFRDEDMLHLVAFGLGDAQEDIEKSKSPLIEAMSRVNQERTFDLSKEQSTWILKSAENYWTWTILAHDKGSWNADRIVEATGFDAKTVAKSLRKLVKLELAEKEGKSEFRCQLAGRVFQHPNTKVYTTGLQSLRSYRDGMASSKGKTLMRYGFFSRGSERELRNYFDYLIKSVQGCEVVSKQSSEDDSIFFEVETVVKRILAL
ncbi:MAG: hypothetical protein COB53_08630 [Elusimicrobia bacterium]|nr:MAG: hypothetical protein COB53_08630 [Elusimicrobiota bacterium]